MRNRLTQFGVLLLVALGLLVMVAVPMACDIAGDGSSTSARPGASNISPADYRGGPMPLREARQLAKRCSEGFAAEDDKKLQVAFEDTIIIMLAHRDAAQRAQAAGDLGTYRNASAIDALLLAVEDDSPTVRSAAVSAIGWIDVKNAALSVAGRLQDSDPAVRKASAETLSRLANPVACDALIVALKDSDPAVRAASASALGWCRDSRAIKPLIASLKDSDPKVRSAAAGALGLIGPAESVKKNPAVMALINSLVDSDIMVRYMAAGALGKFGDTRALVPLRKLREDANLPVRNQAEAALRKLNKPRLRQIIPTGK